MDFVLQPEEEFLDAHPGQSKVRAALFWPVPSTPLLRHASGCPKPYASYWICVALHAHVCLFEPASRQSTADAGILC